MDLASEQFNRFQPHTTLIIPQKPPKRKKQSDTTTTHSTKHKRNKHYSSSSSSSHDSDQHDYTNFNISKYERYKRKELARLPPEIHDHSGFDTGGFFDSFLPNSDSGSDFVAGSASDSESG